MATVVAVFKELTIQGHAVATLEQGKTRLRATFTHLPEGKHGFHIHRAGDLRGEGCQGACEHFHVGPPQDHGSKPGSKGQRHTGDLGNIELCGKGPCKYSYLIPDIKPEDLLGRALIIHEDEDDLGLGDFPDSKTTGHSGKRIGCALFGRATCSHQVIRPRPLAEGSPVYKTGLIKTGLTKTRRKTRH
jgi:Cu-Zn family superoxide dismutase